MFQHFLNRQYCFKTSIFYSDDVEYWSEDDLELEEDFAIESEYTSPQHLHTNVSQDEGLNEEEQAVIWWLVAFTCIFETLYTVSSRAMGWLLCFLGSLLQFLGHYSQEIAKVALPFLCTLYHRSKYLI